MAKAMEWQVCRWLPSLLLAAGLAAQSPCNALTGTLGVAQNAFQSLSLPGLVVRVDQHGQPLLQQTWGSWNATTVMALASGSKPLTVAVVLSVVDQGLIALDDPVGLYLPEYANGAHAAITLRMCLAHTSGLPSFDPVTTDPTITLRQSAFQISQMPLVATPGTLFDYGNISMQVAAAVCEVVTSSNWHQLFQQRIAGPLGMAATNYQVNGPTSNPGVADSAVSNADDFSRFLEMLRQGGNYNGNAVLSPVSVGEMLVDQSFGIPVLHTPHPNGVPCGLGFWLERQDAHGRTLLANAPGAFGFFGWLDLEHDAAGVWLGFTFYVYAYTHVMAAWDELDVALAPVGVACVGVGSPACAAPPQFHAETWPRAGQSDFAVAVRGAPPTTLGAVSFRLGVPGPGTPLLGIIDYIAGPVVLPPFGTDAQGAARLPIPLPAGLTGLQCTMQGVWVDPQPCGGAVLVASHALHLDVQAP